MSIKKDILFRAGIIYFIALVSGFAVIAKIAYIQIIEGKDLKKQMDSISLTDIIIEPNRGDILASDYRVLATSLPSYDIRMDTKAPGLTDKVFNSKIDSLAKCLAQIPGRTNAAQYKTEIVNARKKGLKYFLIDRRVRHDQMKIVKKYPIFNLGSNKGGLIIVPENIRFQPQSGLAARTIGYLTKEPNGNYPGLEGAFNQYLQGEYGVSVMQRLAGGTLMPIDDVNSAEPQDGGDVVSTIDINIQDVAETSLRKRLEYHNAHHGTAIVMEVKTGMVKAIVNLGKDGNSSRYRELYNYALGESIEPGSTFKLMSYMAVLEDGYIQPGDSINNGSGSVLYYGKKVHDDQRPETLGWLTVEEAFAHSSNVSVTKIIDQYYKGKEKQFIDRLYSMNLNQKLGLELSGEGEPDIKYPESRHWSGVSLTQMAYGYEVRLTPIQVLAFYNAVANGGKMVKPLFVKALRRHGSIERSAHVEVIKSSIASSSTIQKVRKMMEATVEYGTAKRIRTDVYRIAGKTGTAQIANEKFGYRDKRHYASFVGYFPADQPKYSCIVTIYAPTANGTGGGTVAAPVFREIADKVYAIDPEMQEILKPAKRGAMADVPYSKSGFYADLNYVFRQLDIPVQKEKPEENWVNVNAGESQVELKDRSIAKGLVPNVVDMGLKDALYLLEEKGLRVSVTGRGRVISQSVAPGSNAVPNDLIVLEMSQ